MSAAEQAVRPEAGVDAVGAHGVLAWSDRDGPGEAVCRAVPGVCGADVRTGSSGAEGNSLCVDVDVHVDWGRGVRVDGPAGDVDLAG